MYNSKYADNTVMSSVTIYGLFSLSQQSSSPAHPFSFPNLNPNLKKSYPPFSSYYACFEAKTQLSLRTNYSVKSVCRSSYVVPQKTKKEKTRK